MNPTNNNAGFDLGTALTPQQIAAKTANSNLTTDSSGQQGVQTSTGFAALQTSPFNPTAPAVAPITNPITPPATTGTSYTPPPATAPNVADQFNNSLASTLATQQNSLKDALAQQTQKYQAQIDTLNQQKADNQDLIDTGLTNENSAVTQETQAKQAALDQEKQQFTDNYNARQKLTDQLTTLLQQGQDAIASIKGTSGMSSIMNARISDTVATVQAQAGVITAALSAYDSQITLAQNQLKSATDAITSIFSDQISYWKSVVDFYSGQNKDIEGTVASLSKDQQTYVDEQIKTLETNMNQTQATADAISKAMVDPNTALTYAKAGVSLTDTPAQINQKLATYGYSQELSKLSQDMAGKGYSSSPVPGSAPLTVQDSQGVSHTFYATTKPGTGTGTPGGGTPTPITPGAPSNYGKADKAQIDTALRTGTVNGQQIGNPMGTDGYIDPASYVSMLNYWVQQGGTKETFVSQFPPKTYINPANTWVWSQIGIKNPSASATDLSSQIDSLFQ